jgi:hypothetical protein
MINRATIVIGSTSALSSLFFFVRGTFQFIWLPAAGAVIALLLGLLACLAGWLGNRVLTLAVGGAFLLADIALLALLVRHGFLIGNGSAFSLWLGLGAGLVTLGIADRRPTVVEPAQGRRYRM